ncbi:MAG: hypothetical protein HKN47_28615 [Pirellulaceae bacterium]|nr:hypothetical protein [Pirellulaceae bacterium]
MRDPNQKLNKSYLARRASARINRASRRAVLAATIAIATTSVGQGQDPERSTMRILPPLPVQQVAGEEVKQNPFCGTQTAPAAVAQQRVQLASTDNPPPVRLKSSGATVGLKAIGSRQPLQVRPSAMKIDTPAPPSVQINPLIQSEHHENPDLVSAGLSEANERLEELELTRRGGDLKPAIRLAPSLTMRKVKDPSAEPNPGQASIPATDAVTQDSTSVVHDAVKPSDLPTPPPELPTPPTAAEQAAAAPTQTPDASVTNSIVQPAVPVELAESAKVDTDVRPAAPVAQLATPIVPSEEPAVQRATPTKSDDPTASVQRATPVAPSEVVAKPSADTAKPATADSVAQSKPEPAPVVSSDPVFFSMSDSEQAPGTDEDSSTASSSDVADSKEVASDEAKSDLAASELADNGSADDELKPIAIPVASPETPQPVVDLAEPVGLQPIPHEVADSSDELRAIAPEPQPPVAIYRSEPVLPAPVANDRMSIVGQKRYRPPVAVDAPPVAIESATASAPTVQPALSNPMASAKSKSSLTAGSHKKTMTQLRLSRAQVRSLTIGGNVRRITVADQNVCRAIAAGPNQVKLIGTGNGVTQLVVWADTDNDTPTRVRAFEIHVEDAIEATGDSVVQKTYMLNQSIAAAFPNVNVSVQQYRDHLIVSGDCDTEDQARKIVRMVRKTCLVPVRDEIRVR